MFLDTLTHTLNSSIHRYNNALQYLTTRKISKEEIEKYTLGYGRILHVPDDGTDDYKQFMEEMWRGKKLEDKIIFPIKDQMGRVVGVYGRPLDSKLFKTFITEEGKYTGFFFGLYQALEHIYKTGRVYVVEGDFDCIALSRVFPNTVASLTAGMNEQQILLLQMFCDTIVTVFDSDKTGDFARSELEKKVSLLGKTRLFQMSLGYKDPDKCFELLGLNKFTAFINKKMKEGTLF